MLSECQNLKLNFHTHNKEITRIKYDDISTKGGKKKIKI